VYGSNITYDIVIIGARIFIGRNPAAYKPARYAWQNWQKFRSYHGEILIFVKKNEFGRRPKPEHLIRFDERIYRSPPEIRADWAKAEKAPAY